MCHWKICFCALAAITLAALAAAKECVPELVPGGTLAFPGTFEKIEWAHAGAGWKNLTRMNPLNTTGKVLSQGDSRRLNGEWQVKSGAAYRMEITLTSDGASGWRYQAKFQTDNPIAVSFFAPTLTLPTSARVFQLDGRDIPLPATLGKRTILNAPDPVPHELTFQSGTAHITLRGTFGINVQDERFYRQNQFSLRLLPENREAAPAALSVDWSIRCEPLTFTPLQLTGAANMGFVDPTPDDGKGGWTDQGQDNDLSGMETGNVQIKGVPFSIVDPARNAGRGAIVTADRAFRRYPPTKPLAANGKSGRWLYLLHASAWTRKPGENIGTIAVDYMDGEQSRIPVISGKDCGNWWRPSDLDNAKVGRLFPRSGETYGLYLSHFELKDKPLRQLAFQPDSHTVWMIVGATLANGLLLQPPEQPLTIRENDRWSKLDTGNRILAGSPLDFSPSLERPAGKYGWLRNRNGRLEPEKQPGTNLRFSGVNLCNQHLFMPRATADAIVQRIAAMGYNSVRLHHIDRRILDPKARDSFTFDPARVDEINYLYAKCREAGLYLTIDLFSMRPLKPGDGVNDIPPSRDGSELKVLIPLSRGAMMSWKRYTRNLLEMYNPYTRLRWVDDPALFALNLVNEASLPAQYTRYPQLRKVVDKYYEEDLKQRGETKPLGETARKKHFLDFLRRKESEALDEMIRYVRVELGYRGLITNYNYDAWYYQSPLREKLDLVDNHAYLDHPTYPRNKWKLPAYYRQISSLEEFGHQPGRLAGARIFGKPYMLSEVQFCNPNIFRSEAGTLFPAVMALQDYNACYRFSYADTFEFRSPRFFALDNEPVSQLTDKMLYFLFIRGDIARAEDAAAINWTDAEVDALTSLHVPFPADFRKLLLYGRIGTLKSGKAVPGVANLGSAAEWEQNLPAGFRNALRAIRSGGAITSATGEVVSEPAKRRISIVTPRSEAFSLPAGKCAGKVLTVESVDVFSTFGLHARSRAPLTQARELLFFHIANTAATGMRFSNANRNLLEEWGTLPLLVERDNVQVRLRLPQSTAWRVQSLNWDGSVKTDIPCRYADGALTFQADTAGGNMIYHITAK